MPWQRTLRGLTSNLLAAEGLMSHDQEAVSPCQRECTARLGVTIQQEQEAYLLQHPEIRALLEVFVCNMVRKGKRKDHPSDTAQFFTQPIEDLDLCIREKLGIPSGVPYLQDNKLQFNYKDLDLIYDLQNIIKKYYPPEPWKIPTPIVGTPNTESSSFLSIITSETTLPTPEPIPTPEPTLSETLFAVVSNTVDKAIFLHVNDSALRYDTAYVELMNVVEKAMEIPVIEIREDIAELLYNAYKMFELDILEKERIAAEIAWEKRMRKKLKRSLRRQKNFKGYETPPTPKSEISSHPSYLIPPQRPCVCQPQSTYNRYQKDRFGIYLPRQEVFSIYNVTTTPAISVESLHEETQADQDDTKSVISRKSIASKSGVKKVTTFKEN